jgi:ribosomal protein L29
MSANLYERDHIAWLDQQAQLLRAGKLIELDTRHLIEELEMDMGNERRELYKRLRLLIGHLLKWKYQPEMRSSSWAGSIRVQRKDIARIFRDSPSMKRFLDSEMAEAYDDAVELASFETGLSDALFPKSSPFLASEVLDKDFWPE